MHSSHVDLDRMRMLSSRPGLAFFSPVFPFRRRDPGAAGELERVAHALEAELKSVAGAREVQTIGRG